MRGPKGAAAAGVILALATGCGAAPKEAAEVGATNVANWKPCPLTGQPTRQCATVDVPIDWTSPKAGTIKIAVSRLPAGDRNRRVGTLVIDPGGPGASGLMAAAGSAVLPAELLARFDLVGFDRRGVGKSGKVDCGEPSGAADKLTDVEDLAKVTDQAAIESATRSYVSGCEKKVGPLLGHLGTRDVTRDVEAIRQALGEERISLLMFSYGTALAQTYMAMYPTRVRAAVLDGTLDTAPSGAANALSNQIDETQLREADGDAKTRLTQQLQWSLAGFTPWCQRNRGECPIADDPLGRTAAVAGSGAPGEATVKAVQAAADAVSWLPDQWKRFADAVTAGDIGQLRKIATEPFPRDLADLFPAGGTPLALTLGVQCSDFSWPSSVGDLLGEVSRTAATTGRSASAGSVARDYVACALWPRPEQPLRAITGRVRPLVVNSEGDIRTPLAGARAVAGRFDAAVLTVNGRRHGLTIGGYPCVNTAVVNFLADNRPPASPTCS